jgi:hypothetical protein
MMYAGTEDDGVAIDAQFLRDSHPSQLASLEALNYLRADGCSKTVLSVRAM